MKKQDLAALTKRLRPVAEGLSLTGTDVSSFRQLLEEIRQRPVYVLPSTLGPDVLGTWIATDTADYIFYEQSVTPYHQRHIILHEGSHMLCGHEGPTLPDMVSSLTPHLDPKLVTSLLRHSVFDDAQEAEAEVLATLIEERMEHFSALRVRNANKDIVEKIARFLRETS